MRISPFSFVELFIFVVLKIDFRGTQQDLVLGAQIIFNGFNIAEENTPKFLWLLPRISVVRPCPRLVGDGCVRERWRER